MADPLLGTDSITAEWLPGASLYVCRGWAAGPAGTAPLVSRAGFELDVDVAWPGRLAGLTVEARPDGTLARRTADALLRLLGPARLELLVEFGRAGGETIVTLDSDVYRGRGMPMLDAALGAAALARLVASEVAGGSVREALAQLETRAWLRRIGPGIGLGRLGREDAAAAARVLLGRDERWVARAAGAANHEVGQLLRDAGDDPMHDDGTRRRFAALGTSLSATVAAAAADMIVAQPSSPPSVAAAVTGAGGRQRRLSSAAVPRPRSVRDVDRRLLPVELVGQAVRAVERSPSEIEVTLRDAAVARRCWARVFAADGTMLGIAPFRPSGDAATAVVLVAPAELRSCQIDVTAGPGDARPSGALLASESAIAHGRRAAALERAGRFEESRSAWRASAREWITAGDDDRSRVATAYAEGEGWRGTGGRQRVPSPLVADLIGEVD